ncbi:phytanoyl-CoA dioxygenase family protein [Limnohabitans sp.]|uniref:phytanoyl-CoA dioxygenase family protein n=1 Tax=Limnohabitans sp. TaxID=1907725 RepID=UPI002AFF0CF0|nr:phytanoyl-CoA dioxygenase family protein [Limnohabitans sp.]
MSVLTQENITRPEFWQELAPAFHVVDTAFLQSQTIWEADAQTLDTLRELMRVEGYFQLPPQQWGLPIEAMAELVKTLDSENLPLPFAFVYDEYWCLFVRMHRILGGLLGDGYLRRPDFWTWMVNPQKNESGWRPHRDNTHETLFPDKLPKTLTVWLPLTDATPLNGCMYIVPADRDPTYNTVDEKEWRYHPADVRALPAQAGSLFMWNQAVLHWGSHSSPRATDPRISLAVEFQSGNVPPYNQPLSKPLDMPSLPVRLKLVAKQILQYKHMYPLSAETETLAHSLMQLPTT